MYAVQSPRHRPEESIWRSHHHFASAQLPAETRHWLLDQGSLTERLINSSRGQFRVQVLNQCWQLPRHSETVLLAMRQREQALVREVLLVCNNQPWVFARSIIPASVLKGRLHRLRTLHNSSLGTILFTDRSMRRQPFEIAVIDGNSEQLPTDLRQPEKLWGRRCRFEVAGKPLMVSEIFLPDFRCQASSE